MSQGYKIPVNDQTGKTILSIIDQATATNAPVMFSVEGKGDFVMMPYDRYADLIDQTQSVGDIDLENDPLFADIAASTPGNEID